ncbi:DUF1738 domain-containing protein [Synechococcus sp. RSCCF101]|uniref:zincin-like metallopeptidase domain-containing protein n=1 Tax=Synechococcus sp. RSCCF101 TaxID=2511069 RepID=UPI0012478970|nr:zincin-like metallopeptidase domain-containing protein [Synechococcus sp. RSCCF101]QEY32078.1 DUF1738 domain-containing protein [Synechococcus sp. RSCCF101]
MPAAETLLLEELIALLRAGTAPWRRPWDPRAAGQQVNLLSGRPYRGGNPLLLRLAMGWIPSARPYWCGLRRAATLGLVPRAGCRPVAVIQPLPDAGGGRCRFRPVPLVNAADLEGPRLGRLIEARRRAAAAALLRPPERLAAAERQLRRWPVPVQHGGDSAGYDPAADRIRLPERSRFGSAEGFYATWAHEAVHSSGHPSRLNRDLQGAAADRAVLGPAYAREELVAEPGAVLLGDRLQIGSAMANHAAYLDAWLRLLQQTPEQLREVLQDARHAADLICPEGSTAGQPDLEKD